MCVYFVSRLLCQLRVRSRCFFFFQAEDGIRDYKVTGVQTCALPIFDENDRPKLIDFGLARMRHAWEHPDEPFGGTPAYTSPEQARGDDALVTTRSDLFSLGGVLYFLLVGHAPFDARTPDESMERARRCDFDRAALDPVRPRRLQSICLRALAET